MALTPQAVPVSLRQGPDTKTDPKQVALGRLLKLTNALMTTLGAFNKRNGYQALGSLGSAGTGLTSFLDELVAFSSNELYSYSPSTASLIPMGFLTSLDLSARPAVRSALQQTVQDQAAHPSGLTMVAWEDSDSTAKYQILSQDTGQLVAGPVTLPASAVTPRCYALGNYLVVVFGVNVSGTWHLKYIAVPVLAPGSPSAATDLSTQLNATHPTFDGCVVAGKLFLALNGSDGGGALRLKSLDAFLNQSATTVVASEAASVALSVFGDDGMPSNPNVWVTYTSGSSVKYLVRSFGLAAVLAPTTAVGSLSNVNGVTGYASGHAGKLYYQTQNDYPSPLSSTRSDYVTQVAVNDTGTAGSPAVFQRGVALASRPFLLGRLRYLTVSYGGALQPTYFVLDTSARAVARLAYGNGGGYPAKAVLTSPTVLGDGSVQLAYLYKDLLTTQSGTAYTQTGVNLAQLAVGTSRVLQSAQLGNTLNVAGGFLWSYDGAAPTEQNFHLFPEDVGTSASTSGGSVTDGTHHYVALYEWTDAQGNRNRSGTSVPVAQVNTGGHTSTNKIKVPTLRLTAKANVSVVLFRDAPSVATGIFYRLTPVTSPVLNDTTVDYVTFTDTASDASIVGNELLYTTGGVVDNVGGPPCTALTTYKSRLIGVLAEQDDTIAYSKQVVQGEPVEFGDGFKLYVPPVFGKTYDSGRLMAVAAMDDKLIHLRENGLFYTTGDGPDATGANNDFSEPTYITSSVGCVDPRSVVLTPDGIMFKSKKGIWLLDRQLGTSYIGADVEAYNGDTVTSAVQVPDTTQVRFTLSSGIALVYDYYVRQWATFSNHSAVAATTFQKLYTYLQPGGTVMQETPGQYSDAGQPVLLSFTTSWLSLAGIRGYQRAYRIYMLGEYLTPHLLNVSIAYDFNPNVTQSSTYDPSDLANPAFGSDPLFGSGTPYGGNDATEKVRIDLARQQCESFQVTVQEVVDTRSPTPGAGVSLSAILFLVGIKSSYPRQQPSQLTGT